MYYVGVDLGGTNIAVGICNDEGKIIIKGSVPTPYSLHNHEALPAEERNAMADIITKAMADLSLKLIKDAGLTIEDIEYAGIATPGVADGKNRMIVFASTLPFKEYPMNDKFSEFSGIKTVYIENDANAAAKGEVVCGCAKGAKNAVMITLGTGIGGGIIIDGKIYSGSNCAGAEVGHTVIVTDGEPCTCGRFGCYEAHASATALVRQTKAAMEKDKNSKMWELCGGDISKVNGRVAFDGMRMGDETAKAVVDQYIKYVAIGAVNLINIFQPEIFCIGGGISNEKETLLDLLKPHIDREDYSRYNKNRTKLVIATLKNDAGIIGASMLGK
ncbi:MAG: ROK family protein [Ruminococcaceae bacterium]|nr:ROK family protein [Oscillospiraceae bacterium]